ncbi:unnamed protein product [Discosporangium mesarthrocarpum]
MKSSTGLDETGRIQGHAGRPEEKTATWKGKRLPGGGGISSAKSMGLRGKKGGAVSYFLYNKLVGEADGGRQLPEEEFRQLLKAYHDSWEDRIYVHWRNSEGRECIRVKGPCLCLCGHTFKAHKWWAKGVGCRCPGYMCPGFSYLPRQGSWALLCTCKHLTGEHHQSGRLCPCRAEGCTCPTLNPSYTCLCGEAWGSHSTAVNTNKERREKGMPTDPDTVRRRLEDKARVKPKGCGRCMHLGAGVGTGRGASPRCPVGRDTPIARRAKPCEEGGRSTRTRTCCRASILHASQTPNRCDFALVLFFLLCRAVGTFFFVGSRPCRAMRHAMGLGGAGSESMSVTGRSSINTFLSLSLSVPEVLRTLHMYTSSIEVTYLLFHWCVSRRSIQHLGGGCAGERGE